MIIVNQFPQGTCIPIKVTCREERESRWRAPLLQKRFEFASVLAQVSENEMQSLCKLIQLGQVRETGVLAFELSQALCNIRNSWRSSEVDYIDGKQMSPLSELDMLSLRALALTKASTTSNRALISSGVTNGCLSHF